MEVTYVRNALSGADAQAYANFMNTATAAHYLQSPTWAPVAAQPGVGQRYILFREHGELIGAARLLRRTNGLLRSPAAVIERGPVVRDVGDLNRVLPALLNVTKWHGIDQLRIQPYFTGADGDAAAELAVRHGFVESTSFDGPHTVTLRVQLGDLAPEAIFAHREHADLRREARKAKNAGQVVRRGTSQDLATFGALYSAMMDAQDGNDRSAQYFNSFAPLLANNAAALFLGENGGELDSAVLIARHNGQATFHLGASSATRRNYGKTLLPLWQAAEWAHSLGDKWFDLGGVPVSQDDDVKRQSIAKFKHYFARDTMNLTPVLYAGPSRIGTALRGLKRKLNRLTQLGKVSLMLLASYFSPLTELCAMS